MSPSVRSFAGCGLRVLRRTLPMSGLHIKLSVTLHFGMGSPIYKASPRCFVQPTVVVHVPIEQSHQLNVEHGCKGLSKATPGALYKGREDGSETPSWRRGAQRVGAKNRHFQRHGLEQLEHQCGGMTHTSTIAFKYERRQLINDEKKYVR